MAKRKSTSKVKPHHIAIGAGAAVFLSSFIVGVERQAGESLGMSFMRRLGFK